MLDLLICIVGQRIAVILSSVIFVVLSRRVVAFPGFEELLLGLLIVLACVEKICSIMNLVAVERDWVRC